MARPGQRRHRGQQALGIGMRRRLQHRGGRAELDHVAGIHHADTLADMAGEPQVVGDEQQARCGAAPAARRSGARYAPASSRRARWSARRRPPARARRQRPSRSARAGIARPTIHADSAAAPLPHCEAAPAAAARSSAQRRRLFSMPRCRRCSPNWLPMVRTGLSALSGSCGMKAILRPSSARRSDLPKRQQIVAVENRHCPAVTAKLSGNSPEITRPIMLLPAPDSPTSPMISPCAERERDVAQHVDLAAAHARRHRHLVEGENAHQKLLRRSRGSSDTRRPSPSRLKPSTVTNMARIGMMMPQGAWYM